MKKLLAIVVLLSFINVSFATDTSIVFRQIKYTELFKTAKKEQKKILLFFHYDGCGACIEMEKNVFTDPNVYNYYNTQFICFQINILKEEGKKVNEVYEVKVCPTFIFLNENGKQIHKIVGLFKSAKFIEQGKIACDSAKYLSFFQARYKGGDREPGFLRQYCYRLENAYELDSFIINQYIFKVASADLRQEENIKFIYEFAYHNQEPAMPYNSRPFNFMLKNRPAFYQYFDSDQVDARIVFLTLNAIYTAIDNVDEKALKSAVETLKTFDRKKKYVYCEMDGRITAATDSKYLVLHAMLAYYEKKKDKLKYESTLKELVDSVWNQSGELNALAWSCYEKTDDKRQLGDAEKWAKRAVELKNSYANNDTWAAILYKLGRQKEALEKAKKAVELAKMEDADFSSTSELIKKMEQKN